MNEQHRPETPPFFLRPAGLCLFVAALTVLKLFSAANAHFVEDEAYYRLWGLTPALSYYDHPPMIGWWIAVGQAVFGDTVFAVRAPVVLSSLLGSLALWRTASILYDARTAGYAVLFLNTTIMVGVGGILATPDAPSVLFWGLSLWALAELTVSRNPNWWLIVGLMAGLGLLSKYSVLFLGAGIVLWLIWAPDARRWWSCWQLWAGGALAIALFSPVLVWNAGHEWVSFYKQFGRAGASTYTTKYIFEFIGAYVGLLNPLIAVLAGFGAWRLARRFVQRETVASLLILSVLPFLLYLAYHSLHSRVQANWPALLFPAMALIAASFVAQTDFRPLLMKRIAVAGISIGTFIAVIVQVHAISPITGQFARKDPTFQLRGWQEIGAELNAIAVREGATYIATSGYGLNGQLSFLFKDILPAVQLNERIRYEMQPPLPLDFFAKPGLYVAEERRDRSGQLINSFESVDPVGTLTRSVDGYKLENLVVYRISGPLRWPLEAAAR